MKLTTLFFLRPLKKGQEEESRFPVNRLSLTSLSYSFLKDSESKVNRFHLFLLRLWRLTLNTLSNHSQKEERKVTQIMALWSILNHRI